jgi:hypothetical protein
METDPWPLLKRNSSRPPAAAQPGRRAPRPWCAPRTTGGGASSWSNSATACGWRFRWRRCRTCMMHRGGLGPDRGCRAGPIAALSRARHIAVGAGTARRPDRLTRLDGGAVGARGRGDNVESQGGGGAAQRAPGRPSAQAGRRVRRRSRCC